jgi:hypothetical protein
VGQIVSEIYQYDKIKLPHFMRQESDKILF